MNHRTCALSDIVSFKTRVDLLKSRLNFLSERVKNFERTEAHVIQETN